MGYLLKNTIREKKFKTENIIWAVQIQSENLFKQEHSRHKYSY